MPASLRHPARSVAALLLVLAIGTPSAFAQNAPPPLPRKDLPELPRKDPAEPLPPDLPEPPANEGPKGTQDPRPNLVLIIADDLAWDDLGPYGNKKVRTPNLDRLAAEGMTFEQAFLTISSCSPSRASIITGRHPHLTDAEELHWPIPDNQVTFTERLRSAGYWTGAAGKWHLGDAMRDRFNAIKEVDTSGFQLPANAGADAGAGATFVETSIGDAKSGCTDWIPLLRERPADKPFFLWLAAVDPHRPYDDDIIENPHRPEDVVLPPYHPDTPLVRQDYARYYDEITRMDRFIGEVLDELEEQEVTENTLVLFISDNGRPFPRDKTTLYDSGIRTPMIARWPAVVKPGTRCKQLVSSLDIATTLMKTAGVKPGGTFLGKDFSPLLKGGNDPIREFIFAQKNWHDYEDRSRALRNLEFKYIVNIYNDLPATPPADAARSDTFKEMQRLEKAGSLPHVQAGCFLAPRLREELYAVNADPFEINNLATETAYRDTLMEFRKKFLEWSRRTGDQVPPWRTPDEFDRVTGAPTPARIRPRWSKAKMKKEGVLPP